MTNAEANRRYFDSISDSYDSKPWFAVVNNQVTDALRSDLEWIGIPFANTGPGSDAAEVRLLDYACGSGLMTRVFGPYVTETKGVDISSNMVATYNSRARDAGVSENVVRAVVGNLFDKSSPSPSELEGQTWSNFDLATVGFGFHHFEDVVYAATQLKERLRPGGVLVINDFLEGGDLLGDGDGNPVPGSEGNHAVHNHGHGHVEHEHKHHHVNDNKTENKHEHEHQHHHHEKYDVSDTTPEFLKKQQASIVVPHFTVEGVKTFFKEAGLVDVDVKIMQEKAYMEFAGKKMWRTVLFARGRRPMEGKSEL